MPQTPPLSTASQSSPSLLDNTFLALFQTTLTPIPDLCHGTRGCQDPVNIGTVECSWSRVLDEHPEMDVGARNVNSNSYPRWRAPSILSEVLCTNYFTSFLKRMQKSKSSSVTCPKSHLWDFEPRPALLAPRPDWPLTPPCICVALLTLLRCRPSLTPSLKSGFCSVLNDV